VGRSYEATISKVVNAVTEQLRKIELPPNKICLEEHCNCINDEAPTTRPCKLTYCGKTNSEVVTTNDTDDSLKERGCNDIDMAQTFACRLPKNIKNISKGRAVDAAL
jgi:hypothetical protein